MIDDSNNAPAYLDEAGAGPGLMNALSVLIEGWRALLAGPVLVGATALGISFFLQPTFTARTTFLPPQQQNSAASALASLGSLSGLVGGGGAKTPGDQYIALMQSATVADHIVDRFKLMDVYRSKYRFEARNSLANDVRISLGKKDGVVTIEADAATAELAANIANSYVAELRELTTKLQLTEAQQRRAFYQAELDRTQRALTAAQTDLQSSGFNPGALKAEPKAAADAYGRLQASVTESEVKLQALRRSLTDTAPEVQQQLGILASLRERLTRVEAQTPPEDKANYIAKYRQYKYQEALFELFSKQFEMARVDEARDGGLVQVIDPAIPPEYKSRPKRGIIALVAALLTGICIAGWLLLRNWWRETADLPEQVAARARLRRALRRKRAL